MISQHPKYQVGRKKFEAHDFEGALQDYNLVLKDEESPNVYSERGVVYFYLKRFDMSLADMDHAAQLEPENPYRYSSRAYIRDAMGDTEGAIQDYERAVKLDPEDSIAHNNLGLLQEKLGYKEKAKQNYQRADRLADVDELLQRIRKEQKEDAVRESDQDEAEVRKDRSVLALLRNTFTTKSGFKEYLSFIKNGLKS